jgi:hypothetical protein
VRSPQSFTAGSVLGLRMILLSGDWGQDVPTIRAGFWGRAIVLQLALLADREDTWPVIKRDRCSPKLIAKEMGAPASAVEMISKGIVSAISAGLLQVSTDRTKVFVKCSSISRKVDVQSQALTGGFNPKTLGGSGGSTGGGNLTPENRNDSSRLSPEVDILGGVSDQSDHLYKDNIYISNGSRIGGELILTSDDPSQVGRPPSPDQWEISMFNKWRSGVKKTRRAKLDKKRARAIRKATKPESKGGLGFTRAEIERSLDGWVMECATNEFRQRNVSAHEFALMLRDAQHVEMGLQFYENHTTRSDSEDDELTRAYRRRSKRG